MCDLAYLLIVERLERQVLADRQVAALMHAETLPDVGSERTRLDEVLRAEPTSLSEIDHEQAALRRALGVA